MTEDYIYRIIESQDEKYILTPLKMIRLSSQMFSGYNTIIINSGSQQLSKAVVQKIFRTGVGKTVKYLYRVEPDKLHIGCQTFTGPALIALRKWIAEKRPRT